MRPLTIGLLMFELFVFSGELLSTEQSYSVDEPIPLPTKSAIVDPPLSQTDVALLREYQFKLDNQRKPERCCWEFLKYTDDLAKKIDLYAYAKANLKKRDSNSDFQRSNETERQSRQFEYRNPIPISATETNNFFSTIFENLETKETLRQMDIREQALLSDLESIDVAGHFEEVLLSLKGDMSAFKVIVLASVEFDAQIRAIHELLNPPARLDPLLKWLLYFNRLTPEMIELYHAAIEKRDKIYLLASLAAKNKFTSNWKVKLRINGKVIEDVVYVWPDQAVSYELILVPSASLEQQPKT